MPENTVLAHSLHRRLLDLKRHLGYVMFEIAEILKTIKDGELYKPLGYDNFSEYVRNPEIGMNSRTAYYYVQIYEVFIERLGYTPEQLEEYSYDRLRKLAPIITKRLEGEKEEEEVEQIMDDAVSLRWHDFEKMYRDKERNEGHEEFLEAPEYYRCEKCGKWIIAVPISDCCNEYLEKLYKILSKRFDKE